MRYVRYTRSRQSFLPTNMMSSLTNEQTPEIKNNCNFRNDYGDKKVRSE